MSADPTICYLSAVDAQTNFKMRRLSPVELVTNLIDRIEAVEPRVNAFTYKFYEKALLQAKEAEIRFGKRKNNIRRLEGLPIVIKDYHDVKGEITTYGSRLFQSHRPIKSLAYIDRLQRAGAILLARTTTPEFAYLGVTHSDLWGVTRNPWNLHMSPGGSSGGAGAALAAGMTTLADGSDIGGSIRIPAACCGIVGLKPSHGRVPSGGAWGMDPFLAYGPLTRTVADCSLMMNVMAGPHRDDPLSVPTRLRLPLTPSGIRGWRVALSMNLGYFEIDEEMVRQTMDAVKALQRAGAIVEEVDIGWGKSVFEAGVAHYLMFGGWDHPDRLSSWEKTQLSDAAREYPEALRRAPRLDFDESERFRAKMYDDMSKVFKRYRILITPTTTIPAVAADMPVNGASL